MTSSVSLDIAIELIIPDNTAHTVLVALRRLGYEGLREVQRADQFELVTSADAPPAQRIMEQLAHAEVLFNPNKHRLAFAVAPGNAVAGECEALVRDKDDNGVRLQRMLASTFAMPYVSGIVRGVLWRLYDDCGPAPADRVDWACRTLLSNAVSQTYQVRPRLERATFGEPVRLPANIRG